MSAGGTCLNGGVRYILFVLAAAILFGTNGTSQAFAPAGASSLSIGMARLGIGGVVLGLIGGVSWWRGRHQFGRPTWRMVLAVAVGAACVLGYQATFFAGTRTAGVLVGTMIALGCTSPFAGLIEWIVLRRWPTARWGIATVVAVAGVLALSWTTGAELHADLAGVLLALAAGATNAGLTVAMKYLLDRGWRYDLVLAATLGAGGLVALAVLPATGTSWLAEPRGIAVMAWLAFVTLAAASLLMVKGLSGLSAAATTTVGLAEPATASLLGTLVLSEPMTPLRAIGVAAVVAGVLVIGLARPKKT